LDQKQLILRGSTLSNTKWIIGAVVFTGRQTKLMVNQGKAKFKQSKIEKMVNKLVILLVILELLWCFIMATMHGCFI